MNKSDAIIGVIILVILFSAWIAIDYMEKTMLQFTDNQNIEHVFNLENLVHVHVRKSDEKNVTLTMHTLGPHTIPFTVDASTADQILMELSKTWDYQYEK